MTDRRELKDLIGIGRAMRKDFEQLAVCSVAQLATEDPDELYERLCRITGARQDICVLDVFRCAVAQSRDLHLPHEQCQWWWWSRRRLAAK